MRGDYCLRTETKQQTIDALYSVGLVDREGNPIYCDVYYIGPLILENGTVDNNFHTNLLCPSQLSEDQLAKLPIINPTNRQCVWM